MGCHSFSIRDLPKPGVEPRSPTLQADSLPSELPEKPRTLHYILGFIYFITGSLYLLTFTPHLWQLPIYSLYEVFFFFLKIPYTSETISCLSFCLSLSDLSMKDFFFCGWIIFHHGVCECVYHILFVHSFIDWHLDCFHNLAVLNNATYDFCLFAETFFFSVRFKCVHPYFTERFYNNYFKDFVRWFQHLCHHRIVICWLLPTWLRCSWFFICKVILDCILDILNITRFGVFLKSMD